MDSLFKRIQAAAPSPLVLTDDEIAKLGAWLKVNGVRLSYQQRYNAWKANRAGQPTPEAPREAEWRRHLAFVLEYNRNRPKAALSAGSQSPSVLPAEAVSQGDRPDERGYVESPADRAGYVPATDIVVKHTPANLAISMKGLRTILEDYDTNRVRWTRPLGKNGQPVPNRRSVHLGDWFAYLERRTNPESDGFPRLSETELEQRKAGVRDARHAGK